MAEAVIQNPYVAREGDTLVSIARKAGTTVSELQRINNIRDANKLGLGHTIYLTRNAAFGFVALFLDALRHPIMNLHYRLTFDGKTISGVTGASGMSLEHEAESSRSEIVIEARAFDGTWQRLFAGQKGFGRKRFTLVSGHLTFKGRTEAHPPSAPMSAPYSGQAAKPPSTSHSASQPPTPPKASGAPTKNNPAVKAKKSKGPKGESIVSISVDIPKGLLDYFANYKGEPITDSDWDMAAKALGCEVAVLKAFSVVESGGHASFWRLNTADGAHVPAVLYERHYFSHLTAHKYDKEHPDISWPKAYQKKADLGQKDKAMPDGKVEETDVYSDYASAYLRLINAFRLNERAALSSCSWGKFQIMGSNYALCGCEDVNQFVKKVCTSEFSQIDLMVSFIRNKPRSLKDPKHPKSGYEISLWDAVKNKDWAAMAFNYNGRSYKKFSYDTKLKAAYEGFANAKA